MTALLLLDPLVLTALLGLVVYVWVVWQGGFRWWLGHPGRWTLLAWPLPLLVLLGPLLAGGAWALLRQAGFEPGDGGVLGAVTYLVLYALPTSLLLLLPPRWLLPGWARARLVDPPAAAHAPRADAVPALRTRRGHGCLARWVWQVDATPGYAWLDGDTLRFRAAGSPTDSSGGATAPEFDAEALADLRLSADGELRLEPPRGGLWSRDYLDVELPALDRCDLHAPRRWRHGGVLDVEVEGRDPVQLWLADVRALAAHRSASPNTSA